jgi:hypothetical protein
MKGTFEHKSKREIFGFDDTWALIIGIPLVSFLVPLLFFNATLSDGLLAYLPKWGISFCYTSAYWFSCRWLFCTFRKRFPEYRQTRHRLIATVIGIVLTFWIVNWVLDFVQLCLGVHEHPQGVTNFDYHISSFLILILVSSLYESIFFYDRWKKSILETEMLRRQNIESQLEGLKSQVNPHFLFNSLNTLAYIIPENPERGVTFVQKLSRVYRYILEIRDKQIISLAEELQFLNSYIFLLKERFGENLTISLNVPAKLDQYQVVPLSLQILFENAIKHNIISGEDPLLIELWVENGRVIVRNNLQRKLQKMHSTRLGLQNIKNRFAYFTNEEVIISEADGFFTVSLPLILLPKAVASADIV